MSKVILLKIFEDIKPRYRAKSARGAYLQEFEVVKRNNPEPITLEKLAEYVENLNKRFPDREFYLDEKVIDGKRFIVLSQKSKPEKAIESLEKEINKTRKKRERALSEIKRLEKEIEAIKSRRKEIADRLEKIARMPRLIRFFLKPLERHLRVKEADLEGEHIRLTYRYNRLSDKVSQLGDKLRELEMELIRIKKRGVKGVVPLYFDLEAQEVYIPKSVWEKRRKNATYVIHRCLGALGYSTTKYVGTVGRVVKA